MVSLSLSQSFMGNELPPKYYVVLEGKMNECSYSSILSVLQNKTNSENGHLVFLIFKKKKTRK